MAGLLDGVNLRTQMVGKNRLELLLFRLGGKQLFGINVFKVREVIPCPRISHMPQASRFVRGISHVRGHTIAIIDLGMVLGQPSLTSPDNTYVLLTEFNRMTQGFWVRSVDRIVNLRWETIQSPPQGAERNTYLTAVTHVDDELVEVIDVERVLAEVVGTQERISEQLHEAAEHTANIGKVLVIDDSSVARNQARRALEQIGVEVVLLHDGAEALEQLKAWREAGKLDEIEMVISDIEMPKMDGYKLTTLIREEPVLKDLYVMLHSSLSGVFNVDMASKVGADDFLPKFSADELAQRVLSRLQQTDQS